MNCKEPQHLIRFPDGNYIKDGKKLIKIGKPAPPPPPPPPKIYG
jgi:hypothetical protein